MTISMLNRFNRQQHQLLLLTLPKSGVMESTVPDVLTQIDPSTLTGPAWREAQRVRLEAVERIR